MEYFLVTMDIEKTINPLDHLFLLSVLKNFGFRENSMICIETDSKNQDSCVTNSGKTTRILKFKKVYTVRCTFL